MQGRGVAPLSAGDKLIVSDEKTHTELLNLMIARSVKQWQVYRNQTTCQGRLLELAHGQSCEIASGRV
jgi:hypothetical protein